MTGSRLSDLVPTYGEKAATLLLLADTRAQLGIPEPDPPLHVDSVLTAISVAYFQGQDVGVEFGSLDRRVAVCLARRQIEATYPETPFPELK